MGADATGLWPSDSRLRALALAQPGVMFATMLRHFARSAPMVDDVMVENVERGDVIITARSGCAS